MVEILNYRPSDYQQVKEILEAGGLYYDKSDSEERLARKVKNDSDSILVAVEDDRVVGTQFIVEDFMNFLFRLAVHPEYRGKGIGGMLMERAEQVLKNKGHNHVNILVESNDVELQGTYQRRGYEKGRTYVWLVKEF